MCDKRKDLLVAVVSRASNRTAAVSRADNRTHGCCRRRDATNMRTEIILSWFSCCCSGDNYHAAAPALPHRHRFAAAVLKAPVLSDSPPFAGLLCRSSVMAQTLRWKSCYSSDSVRKIGSEITYRIRSKRTEFTDPLKNFKRLWQNEQNFKRVAQLWWQHSLLTVSCLASGDLTKVKLPVPARYDVFPACWLYSRVSWITHSASERIFFGRMVACCRTMKISVIWTIPTLRKFWPGN